VLPFQKTEIDVVGAQQLWERVGVMDGLGKLDINEKTSLCPHHNLPKQQPATQVISSCHVPPVPLFFTTRVTMHFTVLAIILLGITHAVVVPSHPGPFSVTMRVKALTDNSRTDPLNNTFKRRVLLSVFSPVPDSTKCFSEIITYMPPATAASYGPLAQSAGLPADVFSGFQLELCKLSDAPNGSCRGGRKTPQFPLVLFSPGLAESRLLYSVTAKSIAAQGYVVVTMDHPYEAEVVEFPDGSVVRRSNSTYAIEQQLTEVSP
jgi:hypothetical protein